MSSPHGLYIHVPFCHGKCAYCDFYSMPYRQQGQRFAQAIVDEWHMRGRGVSLRTVYLGGGTPSILDVSDLSTIVSVLPLDGVIEFTIEANPEDVTMGRARQWRELGINRVSMGVQSLDDAELQIIGRRHDARHAISAVERLRSAGFDNISLDLIYGLPTQSLDSWRSSLLGLLDLRPQHLSAYMLSYEPRTRLTAMLKSGKISEVSEDDVVEMYSMLCRMAAEAGYEHYEISNFALPGHRSQHNSSYWNGTPYIGLGPGAHSYDGHDRFYNPSDLNGYLQSIESGLLPLVLDAEDDDNRFNDLVMTSLRTSHGLDLAMVEEARRAQLLRDARPYLSSGHLRQVDGRLVIPEPSWLVSDGIIEALMQ